MAFFFDPKLRNSTNTKKDELPPESLSNYYEDRKKIIFQKLDINKNENSSFNFLKKSQEIVNKKYIECLKGGFFQNLPLNIFNLSNYVKENIANYCLIFSLYFNAGESIKALKLFLIMCEHNKNSIKYLTSKIIEQLPKISNSNKIAKYYPTITKTMLQILGIFIKLSGKFHKSILENEYITLYFKIIHLLSITVIKYNPANNEEINNQLKNERRYFYSSCLFDLTFYLLNRFQPLSVSIYILQHILESYGNKLTFVPNEIESILLLKVNYNLGIFYYMNGCYKESISNLNQARDRLLEIKYFPIIKNYQKKHDTDYIYNKLVFNTNSSSNLYNFNEFLADFNKNVNFNRNKFKRASINTNNVNNNKNTFDKQTLISMIKEKNLKIQKENDLKKDRKKLYTTIYLGVNSLLNFNDPITLEHVKEKLFIEIELLLSEIELNHKNFREALNHINTILILQSNYIVEQNNGNNGISKYRESKKISKSKTVNNLFLKNSTTSNGNVNNEESNLSESKFSSNLNLKNKILSESNIVSLDRKKSDTVMINIFSKFKNVKYHLSTVDKNRIMLILEQIERENTGNQNTASDKKMQIKYLKNLIKRNESLNKDRKMITSKEMEKFFIFICSLSLYQLKILNESQPEPSQIRNDLPIIFNNQFQDTLTNSQRMSLSLLETMSLSRYIILKDTDQDISPENLDYRFMKYRIKEADSDEEYYNKIKNKKSNIESGKGRRRSSDSSLSVNTLNNNYGSQKFLNLKKFESECEDFCINVEMLLNSIITDKNKNFINLHKNSIMKLLNQMSKEELKTFMNCPKLLKHMINNIYKKYEIKENGGNDGHKNISNFLFEKKNNNL